MADQVEAWATNQVWPGVEFTCSVELEPMGTGGGLKYTEPHLEGDQVVVVNGDSLLPNLDLPTMLKAHASSGKLLTIAISPIEEAGSFGTVEFDDHLQLTAFKEKAECNAGWVNGGVYIMELKVLESLPTNTHCSLERDLFPGLASSNHVGVYCCDPPLLDMGTPEGLQEMEAYLGNKVP
jgi:NDP-sugar pyrophosphorylase family protein